MLNSVLFPDPLGPMIEMYSARLIEMETPLRACTVSLPIWYERLTSMVRTVYSLMALAVIYVSTLIAAMGCILAAVQAGYTAPAMVRPMPTARQNRIAVPTSFAGKFRHASAP